MMIPRKHTQRRPNSCGPDCIGFVLDAFGVKQEDVDRAWGIDDIDQFENLADTPWNHFAALERLGFPWKIRSCQDVASGKCAIDRTVVLLHLLENPLLKQHWVVFSHTDPDNVNVWWGDGTVKPIQKSVFERMYSGGRAGPQCAFEIFAKDSRVPGIQRKLSWYQRLWARITGAFI